MDYLDKLSDSELEFLNKMMNEYITGTFEKTKKGTYRKDNFHKTKEERKTCTDRNNARIRDLYTRAETFQNLVPIDDSLIDELYYQKEMSEKEEYLMEQRVNAYFENKKKLSKKQQKEPNK